MGSQWSVLVSREFVRIWRTVRIISAQINQSLLYNLHLILNGIIPTWECFAIATKAYLLPTLSSDAAACLSGIVRISVI